MINGCKNADLQAAKTEDTALPDGDAGYSSACSLPDGIMGMLTEYTSPLLLTDGFRPHSRA